MVVAPADGDGHIHVVGGDIAGLSHLAIACSQEIGGVAQIIAAPGVGAGQAFSAFGVENIIIAGARINAERTGADFDHGLQARGAVVSGGFHAQRLDKARVAFVEHCLHLRIKSVSIEAGDIGHQKRADHGHQRSDQQQHNQHQLQMQASQHRCTTVLSR